MKNKETIEAYIVGVDYSHGLIAAIPKSVIDKDGDKDILGLIRWEIDKCIEPTYADSIINATWSGMLCEPFSGTYEFQYVGEDYYRDYEYVMTTYLENAWDTNKCV